MTAITTMGKKAVALFALVALVAGLSAVSVETAYAAEQKGKVTAWTSTTAKAKFAKAAMGKTAGKASSKAKAVSQVKMKLSGTSGKITYQLYTNGKLGKKVSNGKVAGTKGKAAQGMVVKLSGGAAKTYDVYYRVYLKGYGWMGWAKNGQKAGTNDKSKEMTAYQVKLVAKKGGKAPNMDRKAYSSKSGFINKITGDKNVDKKIMAFCAANKMDLKKCFAAMKKSYQYKGTNYGSIKDSFKQSRLVKEAKLFFKQCSEKGKLKKGGSFSGDCYSASAAFGLGRSVPRLYG